MKVVNVSNELLPLQAPPGLKGVVVADTSVGDVRGNDGYYHYRQYSAVELAKQRPFEDVWRLMIDGALPRSLAERSAFAEEVSRYRELPAELLTVLPMLVGSAGSGRSVGSVGSPGLAGATTAAANPLASVRTALSLVADLEGMRPVLDIGEAERRRDVLRMCAVTPVLLCAIHRVRQGLDVIPARPDLTYAENYLWMMSGVVPSPEVAAAIEKYLILTIDHGFNASTFTSRVITSTGADVGSAIVGGLGALSGPLHGGAPSRALALLDEIGSEDRIDEVVRPRIAGGEKIMGFGHAVYRTDDPRSLLLRDVAIGLGGHLADLGVKVERRIVELLAELKPGRQLYANVEFFAGVVMATCGLRPSMFTPTFASSRVVGWSANILEQANDNKIIRPSARYVGPPTPEPVPSLG